MRTNPNQSEPIRIDSNDTEFGLNRIKTNKFSTDLQQTNVIRTRISPMRMKPNSDLLRFIRIRLIHVRIDADWKFNSDSFELIRIDSGRDAD